MTVHSRSSDLQVLGLADPAGGTVDAATVRKAYHRLAKLVHPDRGGTKEAFQLLVASFERLSGKESAAQGSPAEAGGVSRTSTQLDVESTKPVRVRVCVGVHPQGKSCGHVRSRVECLFSLTLPRGSAAAERGGGGGTEEVDVAGGEEEAEGGGGGGALPGARGERQVRCLHVGNFQTICMGEQRGESFFEEVPVASSFEEIPAALTPPRQCGLTWRQ